MIKPFKRACLYKRLYIRIDLKQEFKFFIEWYAIDYKIKDIKKDNLCCIELYCYTVNDEIAIDNFIEDYYINEQRKEM